MGSAGWRAKLFCSRRSGSSFMHTGRKKSPQNKRAKEQRNKKRRAWWPRSFLLSRAGVSNTGTHNQDLRACKHMVCASSCYLALSHRRVIACDHCGGEERAQAFPFCFTARFPFNRDCCDVSALNKPRRPYCSPLNGRTHQRSCMDVLNEKYILRSTWYISSLRPTTVRAAVSESLV